VRHTCRQHVCETYVSSSMYIHANVSCHTYSSSTLHHTLQNTITQCNTVPHTWLERSIVSVSTHCTTRCNTLQHTATHCNTSQQSATHCATYCIVGPPTLRGPSHVYILIMCMYDCYVYTFECIHVCLSLLGKTLKSLQNSLVHVYR